MIFMGSLKMAYHLLLVAALNTNSEQMFSITSLAKFELDSVKHESNVKFQSIYINLKILCKFQQISAYLYKSYVNCIKFQPIYINLKILCKL